MLKDLEIDIDEGIYYLASDISENIIFRKNYDKVKKERISSIVLQKYFYSYNKDLEISFDFKEDKSNNEYRREILPLNLLKIQNSYLYIVNLENNYPKEIYIPYHNLYFDFLIPVFFDEINMKFKVFGYMDYKTIEKKRRAFLDNYQVKTENLIQFEQILDDINSINNREVVENFEKNQYIINYYKAYFENKKIPEDFIDLTEYLPSSLYKELLYSEELAFYYLNLQKIFYTNFYSEESNILVKQSIFDNIKSFIKQIFSINHINILNKYALASTQENYTVNIFEYHIKERKIIKTDIKSDIYINKNNLTISELDNYKGKMWLLFIAQEDTIFDILEKKTEDIFLNWSQEFFDKNKDKLDYLSIHLNSKNNKDVVDETGALDINIEDLSLKSNSQINLALLIY